MIYQMIPLLSMPGGWEWIIILVVVLLLFGGKKIPELMKGVGKGVRSFKEGLRDVNEEINSPDGKSASNGKGAPDGKAATAKSAAAGNASSSDTPEKK